MQGLNKAYLIGHIGQDPELRSTAGGKNILKLSIATPRSRKVGDEWVWHRLTLFDKQAEFVANYAHKGDVVAVECSIRPGKWTDQENKVHYVVDLVVERVLWLNNKPKTRGPQEDAPPMDDAPPHEDDDAPIAPDAALTAPDEDAF